MTRHNTDEPNMQYNTNDRMVWAMFYANICGMQLHPGVRRDSGLPLSWAVCAEIADVMLKHYQKRYGENTCHSSAQ